MKPGRAKGVLRDQPARRKDHEIAIGGAGDFAGCGQHRKDRRVGMVEADRAQRVEPRQIVFVGRVIAVPGDDVERRMVELRGPQIAGELDDDLELFVSILKGGDRGQKIARVGEPVGADRTQFRQAEQLAVILADIAAGARRRGRATRNLTPRGMTAISPGPASSRAEFGRRARSGPSCGTISNSPSASQNTRRSIDLVAR